MKIKLCLDKSLEENASEYYDEAKKYKKKIDGALKVIEESRIKLRHVEKTKPVEKKKDLSEQRKKQWYEKFHWFISSEGFLVIAGRDSTTNEIIMKKHTDVNDVVFHTEAPGSPFTVIKCDNKVPGEKTLQEAAIETASYSKAWKLGIAYTEVFHVKPEQVSKTSESGEYLVKGSFMIRGKKNIITTRLELAIGNKDCMIIGGPVEAIKAQTDRYVIIIQGPERSSDVAKKILKRISGNLDDIITFIPAGGAKIK